MKALRNAMCELPKLLKIQPETPLKEASWGFRLAIVLSSLFSSSLFVNVLAVERSWANFVHRRTM